MNMVFGIKQQKAEVVPGIDPVQKWLTFFYSSVCIQITLTTVTSFLSSKIKEYFTLKEASKANLNADKRILKCQPFLHEVYKISRISLPL